MFSYYYTYNITCILILITKHNKFIKNYNKEPLNTICKKFVKTYERVPYI